MQDRCLRSGTPSTVEPVENGAVHRQGVGRGSHAESGDSQGPGDHACRERQIAHRHRRLHDRDCDCDSNCGQGGCRNSQFACRAIGGVRQQDETHTDGRPVVTQCLIFGVDRYGRRAEHEREKPVRNDRRRDRQHRAVRSGPVKNDGRRYSQGNDGSREDRGPGEFLRAREESQKGQSTGEHQDPPRDGLRRDCRPGVDALCRHCTGRHRRPRGRAQRVRGFRSAGRRRAAHRVAPRVGTRKSTEVPLPGWDQTVAVPPTVLRRPATVEVTTASWLRIVS